MFGEGVSAKEEHRRKQIERKMDLLQAEFVERWRPGMPKFGEHRSSGGGGE
jgi:hypothetical protein